MPVYGPMDAAWWAALGAPARWGNTFTGITDAQYYYTPAGAISYSDWLRLSMDLAANCEFYQAPFLTAEDDAGGQSQENNYDTGFFYLTDQAGFRYPYTCCIYGATGEHVATRHPQCIELVPANLDGELRPMSAGNIMDSAYYKTGFLDYEDNSAGLAYGEIVSWFKCPARGLGTAVYHYAPYAWSGTPPEVVASVLLRMGLPLAQISTAAFANAHDTYRQGTLVGIDIGGYLGDADEAWQPLIYCSRRVGQKLMDMITEIMRHARDMYYVNEAGAIDVSSFIAPLADDTVPSLSLGDGVLGVEWRWSTEYVFNKVAAGWGSAYRCWGSPATSPDNATFGVQQEDELETLQEPKYIHEAQDTASIAKYGEIWLRGRERITATSRGHKVQSAHFPLYLTPGCSSTWWEASGFGGMMHVTGWLKADAKERRFITVTQDIRALDWGIGSKVLNVSVTDDGQTIPETWCIERTYDFDRLTVTSVLMEQPPNT